MAYEYYGENPPYAELDGTLGEVTVLYPNKAPDYATVSIADTFYISLYQTWHSQTQINSNIILLWQNKLYY